ncbi:MAG TPA: DUF3857 domain-containing protein [Bryobacteraceae bacterium]|nr:DUF3857 domain-containing protein [Bryobacteraceae bacterium]
MACQLARIASIAVLLGGCAAASTSINVVAITQWLPVTDEERNLKAPKIDPDAGAEALFWRVHVVDEVKGQDPETVLYHYIRIKVFNQRGCDEQGTQDIRYFGKHTIAEIAGRTIKSDGTIVELKKDAIFKRDLVKAGGLKVKAVSFAMPAVEPGVILEYRWRETRDDELANYVRMMFQRDVPVYEIKYFIRPLSLDYVTLPPMKRVSFGMQPGPTVTEKDGFYSMSLKDVPAYKEEPLMPSEWVVRNWTLLYYGDDIKASPEKFWTGEGKKIYSLNEPYLKANSYVRDVSNEAVAGATSPEEKLARLVQYCRTKIKLFDDESVTEREREKAKENNRPADTLKRGIGSGFDVNMLFAAMARAQGFDVRVAKLGDRGDFPFNRGFLNTYFMGTIDIAVKVGDQWQFYNAATKWLPVGMLPWREEGSDALVTDPKEPVFVQAPVSDPEKSLRSRTGVFQVDEDGTIEGEVHLAFSGHAAAGRREELARESPAQQEDDIREMVRGQMSNAEVSDVKVENLLDADKPLAYSYRVKAPGYAQRTGKRIFVQLAYFQHGVAARFTASERKYPVWFDYPWAEEDDVTIKVPKGFELENAESPASFGLGPVGEYRVSVKAGRGQLMYHRKFVFGRGGTLVFPAASYTALKKAFDAIQEQDQHTITLRQQAAGAGANQ